MYEIDKVGSTIKKYRVEAKISQESLSETVGITPTHLKHIESGHRKPSIEVLFAIFNTLKIPFDELRDDLSERKTAEIAKAIALLSVCTEQELGLIYNIIKCIQRA